MSLYFRHPLPLCPLVHVPSRCLRQQSADLQRPAYLAAPGRHRRLSSQHDNGPGDKDSEPSTADLAAMVPAQCSLHSCCHFRGTVWRLPNLGAAVRSLIRPSSIPGGAAVLLLLLPHVRGPSAPGAPRTGAAAAMGRPGRHRGGCAAGGSCYLPPTGVSGEKHLHVGPRLTVQVGRLLPHPPPALPAGRRT